MTDAQRDVLAKIRELMNEHFDSWVLSFQTENTDHTDILDVMWHGGFATALGLTRFADDEILTRQKQKHQETD